MSKTMSSVKQFLESLEKPVAELADMELADVAEDSTATWTRRKVDDDVTAVENKVEFLKHRLRTAQEFENGRYAGTKVSSKSIFTGDEMADIAHPKKDANSDDEDDDIEDEDRVSDIDSIVADRSMDREPDDDFEYEGEMKEDDDNDDDDDDDEEEEEGSSVMQRDLEPKNLLTISSDVQHRKAESVQKQLMIWDRLMHLHILFHAALRSFNQLPREQLAEQLQQSADDDTIKNCKIMRRNLLELSDLFGTLEDTLLKTSKHTKGVLSGNDDVKEVEDSEDEEIESSADEADENDGEQQSEISSHVVDDGENGVISASNDRTAGESAVLNPRPLLGKRKRKTNIALTINECVKRHERFAALRLSTLSKWDERTTLIGFGATRNKQKDFSAFESVVVKQIEQIMNEKHRLLRRTQMKRNDLDRMGSVEDSNYDAEIFDDDDFYQQLLKELIERKSVGVVDPVEMSRQWLEIQGLRQKRSKRKKVDTKASKGRKIRYAVIPELVNYFPSMAESAKWSHESRNQLFRSLFVP